MAAGVSAVTGLSSFAQADSARLEAPISVVADGVEGCPDAVQVLTAIEARLGSVQLGPDVSRVTIIFERRADRVVARVALGVAGSDERAFKGRTCASVAQAVSLFLVVALAGHGEPAEDEGDAVAPLAPAAAPAPVHTHTRVHTHMHAAPAPIAGADRHLNPDELSAPAELTIRKRSWAAALPPTTLGVGVVGHVGLLPGEGSAIAFDARVGGGRWTLAVGTHWSAPVTKAMAGGELVASMIAFRGGPCLQAHGLEACAIVTGGRMDARGQGFSMSSSTALPYVAAGARVGYAIPLGARVAARIHLDANGTVTRARLAVTGAPADEWTAPPGWLAAGISFATRFL